MSDYRINYNPFNQDYISGYNSHTEAIYNHGKQKSFDDYIRGIIIDNTLYLRVYYPFNDIDTLTTDKLYQASYTLLNQYKQAILKAIKKHENININDIKFNITNDLLKNIGLTNV